MNTRSSVRSIAILAFLTFCAGSFAQTFTVNGRTTPGGDLLKLDQSLRVVYNVTASGLTQPVVPELVVTNASLAESVNVTWEGTSAVTSLSNLAFNIHVYDDDTLCSQTLNFELRFYSSQFTGYIVANPTSSSLMQFDTTGGGQIVLTDTIADTQTLPWPLTSNSQSNHFLQLGNVPQATILNPENRIYFWADYNLAGQAWGSQFLFFLYQLDNQGCALNASIDIGTMPQVEGEVVDATVTPNETLELAPLGGAGSGPTLGLGINIFDVTDINPADPDCASSVRQSIDYSAGGIFNLVWNYAGINTTVRRFGLFVGQVGGCTALVDNFGTPPAAGSFRVDDFYLSSYGNVEATLEVPAAWGSGGTLGSDFRLTWYLRTDSSAQVLGGETQDLDLSVNTSLNIENPEDYYLEARIRHTGSDAMVSTISRDYNHNIAYDLQSISFQRGEQIAITGGAQDSYLDPGEILGVPLQLTVPGGGSLPTLGFEHGLVIDANANGTVDASDTFLTGDSASAGGVNIRFIPRQVTGGSSSTNVTLFYELLTAHTLPDVWFYLETERTDGGGTTSTYRRYFSLQDEFGLTRDLNAEITTELYSYDFGQGSGAPDWSATVSTTPNGTSGSWEYGTSDGAWIGDGGTHVSNADEAYRLASPVFPIGADSNVNFQHLPQFSFNQSGGMLQFRARTAGGAWTQWDNFVDNYCSSCGYYNSIPFPSLPSSILSDEMVWMSNEETTQSVSVDIPNSLGNLRDELQLRFVFADPSLVDTGRSDGPTHWEVYNFNYQTTRLTEDNIFGIDFDQLEWDACDDPRLEFESWAPVGVNDLTFEWYASLDDLYDDVSTGDIPGAAGASVPFNPSTNGTYTYYVRVKYLGTERIVRVIVNHTEVCTNTCITMEEAVDIIRSDASVSWPGVKKVTDCVSVVNRICK